MMRASIKAAAGADIRYAGMEAVIGFALNQRHAQARSEIEQNRDKYRRTQTEEALSTQCNNTDC